MDHHTYWFVKAACNIQCLPVHQVFSQRVCTNYPVFDYLESEEQSIDTWILVKIDPILRPAHASIFTL